MYVRNMHLCPVERSRFNSLLLLEKKLSLLLNLFFSSKVKDVQDSSINTLYSIGVTFILT